MKMPYNDTWESCRGTLEVCLQLLIGFMIATCSKETHLHVTLENAIPEGGSPRGVMPVVPPVGHATVDGYDLGMKRLRSLLFHQTPGSYNGRAVTTPSDGENITLHDTPKGQLFAGTTLAAAQLNGKVCSMRAGMDPEFGEKFWGWLEEQVKDLWRDLGSQLLQRCGYVEWCYARTVSRLS
ncbi:hypothetical protein BU15DRAFT_59397 [Melanogaster broomeanus]|nr:hypothetical protein BU15DRAFT_59397 [Melanogaster broomeanus]